MRKETAVTWFKITSPHWPGEIQEMNKVSKSVSSIAGPRIWAYAGTYEYKATPITPEPSACNVSQQYLYRIINKMYFVIQLSV
jgi:hypothetical protein